MKPERFDDEAWQWTIALIRDGNRLVLPEDARAWFADVLDLLRRGEDPRKLAGTTKAANRPSADDASSWWMALHYFLLVRTNGKGGSAAANCEVAKAWGLTVNAKTHISRTVARAAKLHPEGRDRVATFSDQTAQLWLSAIDSARRDKK